MIEFYGMKLAGVVRSQKSFPIIQGGRSTIVHCIVSTWTKNENIERRRLGLTLYEAITGNIRIEFRIYGGRKKFGYITLFYPEYSSKRERFRVEIVETR